MKKIQIISESLYIRFNLQRIRATSIVYRALYDDLFSYGPKNILSYLYIFTKTQRKHNLPFYVQKCINFPCKKLKTREKIYE